MSRKPTVTVTSRAEGGRNRNAALARRLAGNPHASGSRAVPLKHAEIWATRWANNEMNDNRHWQMTHELGWEPVTREDLEDGVTPDSLGLRVSEDGGLVRGARGNERLYKMRKEDQDAVMARKTEYNLRGVGSAAKIKQDAANAAAASHGTEAADYIANLPGEVVDKLVVRE